ncbi:MAG TPA: M1 family metallopeptidase [Roseiflexaceae bacterium]|nr:M1 family metallopeptidase [Roseiflexaceae bacterium]
MMRANKPARPRSLLLLLLLALLLPEAAHAAPPAPLVVPYADAMRPQFAGDVERPDLPQYTVQMDISPLGRELRGTLDLLFRNMSSVTLPNAVLRLYANFPRDVFGDGGTGAAAVADVHVNGQAVQPSYLAQRTAVQLPFPKKLAPGEDVHIRLSWSVRIAPLHGTDDTLVLTSVIPQLAVWDGKWRTDVTVLPDHVYATSGLYHAFVTAPTEWMVASGGTEIARTTQGTLATSEIVTGPVREFAFALGHFQRLEEVTDGVSVRVLYRRDGRVREAAVRKILRRAIQSLSTTTDRYGPYPYRALSFCVLEAGRGYSDAREYPGFIVLLLDHGYSLTTHEDVAHEVGHQWFYGIVGNDIYQDPWMDEALAQYTTFVVMQQWDGAAAANNYFNTEIAALGMRSRYSLREANAYPSWSSYYASVYGKGGLFIAALRGQVGDKAFFAGLRQYVERNRYNVARPDDLRRALEDASGQKLTKLFGLWLGMKGA